jgi:hypothetical protein
MQFWQESLAAAGLERRTLRYPPQSVGEAGGPGLHFEIVCMHKRLRWNAVMAKRDRCGRLGLWPFRAVAHG